jgi:hypothetical protein
MVKFTKEDKMTIIVLFILIGLISLVMYYLGVR